MPQFVLDHGTPEAATIFAALNDFEQGYVEAIFFTADEELQGASFAELSADALAQIKEDCLDFNLTADAWLHKAYGHRDTYTSHQAGVDFWFTRNHHGAGFWDRGLGEAGNKLTELSHPYGSCDLYRGDDGQLYLF